MARYIDADMAVEMFTALANDEWNKSTGTTWADAFADAADMIEDTPSADVRENVRGKWELDMNDNWNCDKCGYVTGTWSIFCPNCGADMRGDNNED